MTNNQSRGKQIILEFLDYIRFKITNDTLTFEEADAIAKVLENSLNLTGTAEDLSKFYGKTKTNVTTVIDRKMLSRPKRSVLHSFNEFRKVVPPSWIHGQR